ncbi:class I SAM-dependent methyltransferase [Nocardioides sp. zg-536]|uniref:Class I SAM-dependent methyltransferase n=1 Tax=Nocardioides faecalis TaxID=2803858 RepID=A0A938YB68_9ACTN|nr:class I SAM-dependent methyltransferase [Nocardioides faecalis]MBM9461438.1 class I SAM-dependent methyltransferase [Nocardioides faecalis]MBS4751766.1 class I SAM-dependent methyltransferase [Nocardioides faecalis]QVI59373.1 class I SAM-dependent methyltransferase [Nocardioides faecalis]
MNLSTSGLTLHREGAGNWMISEDVLAFLEAHVSAGDMTVETGAGYSTIVLAALGAHHTSVTPAEEEADAITAYCVEHQIPTDSVRFLFGYSQDVLPGLDLAEVDLALIDGGHGFPVPAVDFMYLAPRLKVGGHLLIDDVDIWTGAMIVSVLKQEPEWEYGGRLARRTAVFRKVAPYVAREWCDQPAVVAKSRITRATRQTANGLGRLAQGDLAGLRDRLRRAAQLRAQRR